MNRPRIAYDDFNRLLYAWYDGTAWITVTVAKAPMPAYNWIEDASLALDASDLPHVSYTYVPMRYPIFELVYARYDGVSWHRQTVDGGWQGYLALDSSGLPRISYVGGNTDLRFASRGGTTWIIETVDSQGWVGYWSSLALDSSGRPHISYSDGSNDDLKYAWHDGMGWHIGVVDSGEVGWTSSLALDSADRPHIAYFYQNGGPDVRLA